MSSRLEVNYYKDLEKCFMFILEQLLRNSTIHREDEGVVVALDDPFDNFGEVPDGFGVESGIKGGCLAAEEELDVAEQLGDALVFCFWGRLWLVGIVPKDWEFVAERKVDCSPLFLSLVSLLSMNTLPA
ncbi:hypothetical protein Vadar_029354 [Vaccinium darrowii]|uniref:Uncharacterized protein n=1 Tax=Vaccinium darrowii TaxID=229202 RepID=A0ACB7Y3E9_9ERIC|nr:hypothetical protein Vadar_029354 [Vaccinium darrowii]